MRSLFYVVLFTLCGTLLTAQPANDNCSGLVDLGVVPACPPTVFTNVGATASNIGFGNIPSCFNGGNTQRDVWFSFTTTTDLINLTITVLGDPSGPNSPILNPQIALYRGSCEVDGLAELACISANNGDAQAQLDILGLTPGETYFIRINDYSATATPNSGDFTLCVEEYVPAINIGDEPSTTACFGTLYDSGGPDDDYQNGENHTFTICPNDFHECIQIDIADFQLEQGFDFLTFYAGNDINAPQIARLTGISNGQPFPIQASSGCITVQFTSDGSAVDSGFELTWQCSPLACDGSSVDAPTVIPSLPYVNNSLSTCNSAAQFNNTACANDAFLNGPEWVFVYESPGDLCASVTISNAQPGTGVLVLNGPPDDPATICVAQNANGSIAAATFETPGTYYIVVDNASGCTDFDISITPVECLLAPGLASALCNPLNGCINPNGLPSVFMFQDGFQDIPLPNGSNDGCWLGVGAEADFYWFTIQAQADGPFGFILESAGAPSDIDFSVWGPFTQQEVCETPLQVINYVTNNQPIRSSWAAGADPTGLADIHPVLGTPVTDTWDCGTFPGAGGDDFVSTIDAHTGEVYIVLSNDFGNAIGDEGISVDWSPSEPEVLTPIPTIVEGGDTTVCIGESVQLSLSSAVDNIQWIEGQSTLSCDDCFDPVATPTESTVYKAIVDATCYVDTIKIEVKVFDVHAGPDLTLCIGEEFEITAGESFTQATYSWNTPAGLQLSCTDCPNPTITTVSQGVFPLIVTLNAPTCVLKDTTIINVLPQQAPQVSVSDDQEICIGSTVDIGGSGSPGVVYTWSSTPAGFTSNDPNPAVTPVETTVYYVSALGNNCPVPTIDSVLVQVYTIPVLSAANDTLICQAEPIVLGNTTIEPGTVYLWEGPDDIVDPSNPNTLANPQQSGTYILTATRGACVATEAVNVAITNIALEILQEDTLRICKGTTVNLQATIAPSGNQAIWTPNDGSLNTQVGNSVFATPQTITTYIARASVPGCTKMDTVTIVVDSLPSSLVVMPMDTQICEGQLVLLTTPIFEPGDFPDIDFVWRPFIGQQSPDTLFNLVVTPDTTTIYYRIATSGVCVDTSYATVNVTPIPQLTLIPSDTILCQGQSLQLNAIFTPDVDMVSWEPATGLSCTDCLNPVATPGDSQQYTVNGSLNGCPAGGSVAIQVIKPPVISVPQTLEICEGQTTPVLLLSPVDASVTYTWSSPDIPGFSSNDPLVTVSPSNTATYVLNAVNECFTREAQVTVFVVKTATVSVNDVTICAGDPVTLTADGSAPIGVTETYSWSIGGATYSGPTITVEGLTTTTDATLTYSYGPNCGTVEEPFTINVIGNEFDVSLNAIADSLLSSDTLQLSATVTPDNITGVTYTWFADGVEIGQTTTSTFDYVLPFVDRGQPGLPIAFSVVATSPEGCERQDADNSTIYPIDYKIPNVFTPNEDGKNDVFKVFYEGKYRIKELRVYNRWGQMVYEGSGSNAGWDGKHKGEDAPSDVYVYHAIILLGDREFEERGDVTLVR